MIKALGTVTVHVANVEEAVEFYTEKLGLVKKTDQRLGKLRWVTVGPKDQELPEIFLKNPQDWYDKNTADRFMEIMGWTTTWVFRTDDCKGDYKKFKAKGVKFTQEPKEQPYGIEAVFVDPWDNPYALLERLDR
jgi:predicted enzyme related to lactoylglutathione lyase